MLVFVGAKMLLHDWVPIPTAWSLGIVLAILTVAIVVSLLRPASPEEIPDPLQADGDFAHSPAAHDLHLDEIADRDESTDARTMTNVFIPRETAARRNARRGHAGNREEA